MPEGQPGDHLDPTFLLDQATRLTASDVSGHRSSIDARRAASAAYYAAYHAVTREVARSEMVAFTA